jgi:solute carrier family 35, member E3
MQVMKIAVAPTVIALELLMFGTLPNKQVLLSVFVVCIGIAVATVTDSQLISNLWGVAIGMAATLTTALYQIWAGSKQKELKASSMQLLHAYTPHASIMLGLLVPLLEPVGWKSADTGTLLGYEWTVGKLTAVLISSVLGVLVSLSTFLFIGATSSLTYNVVSYLQQPA